MKRAVRVQTRHFKVKSVTGSYSQQTGPSICINEVWRDLKKYENVEMGVFTCPQSDNVCATKFIQTESFMSPDETLPA